MPAFDMAGFMGDNADDLIGRFGVHQGTGIDKQTALARYKGVKAPVPHQNNGGGSGRNTGSGKNGTGIITQ